MYEMFVLAQILVQNILWSVWKNIGATRENC